MILEQASRPELKEHQVRFWEIVSEHASKASEHFDLTNPNSQDKIDRSAHTPYVKQAFPFMFNHLGQLSYDSIADKITTTQYTKVLQTMIRSLQAMIAKAPTRKALVKVKVCPFFASI